MAEGPFVFDFTGVRNDRTAMKRQGGVGEMGYLPLGSWKSTTPTAAALARAEPDWDQALVYETTNVMSDGGRPAGLFHGPIALRDARIVGYPLDHIIYWTVDESLTAAVIDAAEQFGRAFASTIGPYRQRCYGGFALVEAMVARGVCDAGWQSYGFSGGRGHTHLSAHRVMFQRADNPTTITDVDVNDVLRHDWAAVADKPAPAPTPPFTEVAMIRTVRNLDGRLELFQLQADYTIDHQWQNEPGVHTDTGWSDLVPTGLTIPGDTVDWDPACNGDGRLELVAEIGDGTRRHCWQSSPGSAFGDWEPF